MIDWVDFIAPLVHESGPGSPFYAGEILCVQPSGDLDWGVYKRMEMEGSHSSKIQIRSASMDDGRQAVRVSGNLVKWFQGHNIFGTDDITGLVKEALSRVVSLANIQPNADELAVWNAGDIDLLRVDVTQSNDFGTQARVMNALRSLDATANLKFRGRGQYNGHSLLFGKGSRHWSLIFYSKAAEIQKHKLPPELRETMLTAHADGLLRMECRLLSMHLKRLKLDKLEAWGDNTAHEVHQNHLSQLSISETTMIDATALDSLAPRLRGVYQLWKDGHDLRAIFPRPTFYRHRKEFLALGIDISVKQDRTESNVVPIGVVLVGQPSAVPDWAVNSPLFFEPRFHCL